MPQIDFVSFHYIINALSFSYLFCYVGFTMFLLKPIFKELFCVPAYRTRVVLHVMLSRFVCEDKIIFVAFPKPPRNLWHVLMTYQDPSLAPTK